MFNWIPIRSQFPKKTQKVFNKLFHDPSAVTQLENPSQEVLETAIKINFRVIAFINPLTPNIVRLAVSEQVAALKHLPVQDDAIYEAAIQGDPRALKYIPNPSDELVKLAIGKMGNLIGMIKYPSEELQTIAVTCDSKAITRIVNPCEAAQLIAIEDNFRIFENIPNPTLNAALAFIDECEKYARKDKFFKWNFKMDNCVHLTKDEWWQIVQAHSDRYNIMLLDDEQINYAILCA